MSWSPTAPRNNWRALMPRAVSFFGESISQCGSKEELKCPAFQTPTLLPGIGLQGHRTHPAQSPPTSNLSLAENSVRADYLGSSIATSDRDIHFYNNHGQTDRQLCDGYT